MQAPNSIQCNLHLASQPPTAASHKTSILAIIVKLHKHLPPREQRASRRNLLWTVRIQASLAGCQHAWSRAHCHCGFVLRECCAESFGVIWLCLERGQDVVHKVLRVGESMVCTFASV